MAVTPLEPTIALVLIDLQAGTLAAPTKPYSGAEVVAKAVELADAFRAAGAPVVLVRNTNAPDGSDYPPGRSEAALRAGGGGPRDLGPIAEPLLGHDSDLHIVKHNWGAFYGTDLDLQLRRRGITQIVLGGLATSLGVESTARSAQEAGYHVVLATDAMSDINSDAHDLTTRWIFPMLGETGTTAEILELLAKARA
jgi:nicotinamidase-related amidase